MNLSAESTSRPNDFAVDWTCNRMMIDAKVSSAGPRMVMTPKSAVYCGGHTNADNKCLPLWTTISTSEDADHSMMVAKFMTGLFDRQRQCMVELPLVFRV